MIGLIVIAVGLAYLLISVWVVKLASRAAKRRGVAGWKWGLPAALVMYILVFWDLIPTLVAHKYYCSRYAGFTVYKTLDQWKVENPGIEETLAPYANTVNELPGEVLFAGTSRAFSVTKINPRFVEAFKMTNVAVGLPITKVANTITDKLTGVDVAEYVDFKRGYGNMMTSTDSSAWKFWLYANSCPSYLTESSAREFVAYRQSILDLGD